MMSAVLLSHCQIICRIM